MASAAQVRANRANAQHSTGPVTAGGKAASSHNSLRHGLTSKQALLTGEDPAAYATLRDELFADLKPANAIETALALRVVENYWRLQRAQAMESDLLSKIPPDFTGPHAEAFDRLQRYLNSIERAWYRSVGELEKLQRARRRTEVTEVQVEAAETRKAAAAQTLEATRILAGYFNGAPVQDAQEPHAHPHPNSVHV